MPLCNDIFIQGDDGRIIAMLVKTSDGTANVTVNEFNKIERAMVFQETMGDEVQQSFVVGSGAISGNNIALNLYASGATATSGPAFSGNQFIVVAAGK